MSKVKKNSEPQKTEKPKRPISEMLYVFAAIWFLIAICNFILSNLTVGAIFSAIGFLQMVLAIAQQVREHYKKNK